MKSDDRDDQVPSLSFLDIIACAFGAIVLLVLIIPVGEFGVKGDDPEHYLAYGQLLLSVEELEEEIKATEQEVNQNLQMLAQLDSELGTASERSDSILKSIEKTRSESTRISNLSQIVSSARTVVEKPVQRTVVATEYSGIPVDSEYVAFVIDTSASMKSIWTDVMYEVENVLSLYPQMKGFQILNDQGTYLFSNTRRQWLDDKPARRNEVKQKIRRWRAFSRSSPAKGIYTAVSDLYTRDIKMAVFVFGDDYQGSDFDGFLDSVDAVVRRNQVSEGSLRIHGIAFSNPIPGFGVASPMGFSILMRELTSRNNGAFLALPQQGAPYKVTLRNDGGLPSFR